MRCPYCLHTHFHKPLPVYSGISRAVVYYYGCQKCRSFCQFPLPDEKKLQAYYEDYASVKEMINPGYLRPEQQAILFQERDLTFKEIGFSLEGLQNKHHVELGCANGQFLAYLQSKNIQRITGIDRSKSLIESIDLQDVEVMQGQLTDLEENCIDVLYLFNILEHLPDIHQVMKAIDSRLKKSGQLIIEVPISGLIAACFSKKWRFFMPDEHLFIPSLRGLKQLLKAYHFKIIDQTRFGSGFTRGSIPLFLKRVTDWGVKQFQLGDRGTFLCVRSEKH